MLGPLLFLVYINDINEGITATCKLFADDCAAYKIITSPDDVAALQADLDKLQQWEHTWLMEFNPEKCENITITLKRKPTQSAYTIHDRVLAKRDTGKYLGVTLHKKLSWNTHIEATTKKARRTIGFLNRNLRSASPKVKQECYFTYARPTLEYACQVWDPHTAHNKSIIEGVQRAAARFVTGNYRTYEEGFMTNTLKSLGWGSLESRRADIKVTTLFNIRQGNLEAPIPPDYKPHHLSTRGHSQRYQLPHTGKGPLLHSFYPTTARMWNKLREETVQCETVDQFKAQLRAN